MNKSGFNKKVVLVTGGASGIGLAACREFARRGAKIAMIDMNLQSLETAEKEFRGNTWPLLPLACDVTDQKQCEKAVQDAVRHFNGLDLLFNNAGITQRGLFRKTKTEVYEKVMAINFFGSLYCTKAALPALMESRGTIVVNESVAGVTPLLGRTGYSASKHALHGLFTSLRCEMRSHGVHVMIVCPGFIQTNLQKTALGADGNVATYSQTRVGSQDTAENAARQIAEGVLKRKNNLVLTPVGKLGYYLHRLSPVLYEKMMTRQFQSELA